MDIIKLNPDTFIPNDHIDGYISATWTERYLEPSSFEIKTSQVVKLRKLIPEGSLISHRQTREVCIVETHLIERDDDGNDILTITGRGWEVLLEDRYVTAATKFDKYPLPQQYKPEDAALLIIWNSIVNTTGKDVTLSKKKNPNPPFNKNAYTKSALDIVPNVAVSDLSSHEPAKESWVVEVAESHYEQMHRILETGGLGIRTRRPPTDNVAVTGFQTWGGVVKANLDVPSHLLVEVRNGVNRTATVIFDYKSGHMQDLSIMHTNLNWKNVIIASGIREKYEVGSADPDDPEPNPDAPPQPVATYPARAHAYAVYGDGGGPSVSGRKRRVIRMQFSPSSNAEGDEDMSDGMFAIWLKGKARGEIAKYKRKTLLDLEATEQNPYKFKTHYDLGDYVGFVGDYGYKGTMQVVEHVRIEDNTGEKDYPSLALIAQTGGF